MSDKTYICDNGKGSPDSQIGAALDALYGTIRERHLSGDDTSYTWRLIDGPLDKLLKKVSEESLEVALAAKETEALGNFRVDPELVSESIDHMRYEAGDVIYHLLVLMARFNIPIEELAAELNARMREDERPEGCVLLKDDHIRRRL